jgi:hypothetical protein
MDEAGVVDSLDSNGAGLARSCRGIEAVEGDLVATAGVGFVLLVVVDPLVSSPFLLISSTLLLETPNPAAFKGSYDFLLFQFSISTSRLVIVEFDRV